MATVTSRILLEGGGHVHDRLATVVNSIIIRNFLEDTLHWLGWGLCSFLCATPFSKSCDVPTTLALVLYLALLVLRSKRMSRPIVARDLTDSTFLRGDLGNAAAAAAGS